MAEVGVKALKDQLSRYLRRASRGERIVVTEHGRPIATLAPLEEGRDVRQAWGLAQEGYASWTGGKPSGLARPPRIRQKTTSDMVLEDRR